MVHVGDAESHPRFGRVELELANRIATRVGNWFLRPDREADSRSMDTLEC